MKRKNKYGAKKTIGADGRTYDSKLESKRAHELQLLEKAGEISEIDYQVPYPLRVDGIQIGLYIADFVYVVDGKTVTEDCKGIRTPLFNWKAKHFKAQYGFDITIYPPKKRKKK